MTALALRAATGRDLPFIKNGWLESYRHGRFVRGVGNSIYYRQHDRVVTHLLDRAYVVMCVDAVDPDKLYGFLCCENCEGVPVLHYAYVKSPERRQGVLHRMLSAWLSREDDPTLVVYTHDTPSWYDVIKNRQGCHPQDAADGYCGVAWVYDPYLVFRVLPANWAGLPG